jgi:hypothetical protein
MGTAQTRRRRPARKAPVLAETARAMASALPPEAEESDARSWPWPSAKLDKMTDQLRDIILPSSSGDIVACISAASLRPSPNGTPKASHRSTIVMQGRNIDVASIMTARTGGWLASPKASKE